MHFQFGNIFNILAYDEKWIAVLDRCRPTFFFQEIMLISIISDRKYIVLHVIFHDNVVLSPKGIMAILSAINV